MSRIFRTAFAALTLAGVASAQTAFPIHYQGRLTQAGAPRTGSMKFALALFDDPTAITQVGKSVFLTDVPVVDGLFSLEADFGPDPWSDPTRPRYLQVGVALPNSTNYTMLTPLQKVLPAALSQSTRGLRVLSDSTYGELVGIGTSPKARLHVKGPGVYRGHVAVFENDLSVNPTFSANGIAIKLHKRTNRDDNFITFYDGSDTVTGRIEGFDVNNGDYVAPPVDITTLSPMVFDVDFGTLPTPVLNPGKAPSASFKGGTLPSASFYHGALPSASFSPGSLPSLSFTKNKIGVINGIDFNKGSLPSLSFNPGALPSLSFNAGSLPTLDFDPGVLPSLMLSGTWNPRFEVKFRLPNVKQFEDLFAWASLHDLDSLIQLDPVSLATSALKVSAKLKAKDGGVVYGSKGADYAEWLPKLNPADKFQIGQVVGVFGGKLSLKTKGADQVMTISRMPIVLGNLPADGRTEDYEKAAFVGQVPVVVRGRVHSGDYIVPSGLEDGTAIAIAPENLGVEHLEHLVGRAWSDSENDIYSFINVVVGQRGGEVATVFRNQERRLERLATTNRELRCELDNSRTAQRDLEARLSALEATVAAFTSGTPR